MSGSGQDYTVRVAGVGGEGSLALGLTGKDALTEAGQSIYFSKSDIHTVSGTTLPSTQIVSTDGSGSERTSNSLASESASGRLVAFASDDAVIANGPPNEGAQPYLKNSYVYVKDMLTGGISLIAPDQDDFSDDGNVASTPSLSRSGDVIAFNSTAALTPDAAAGTPNTYVERLALADPRSGQSVTVVPGSLQLVSESNGAQGSSQLYSDFSPLISPVLSGDGSAVAFSSRSTVAAAQVYLKNLTTGNLTLVSVGATGAIGNEDSIVTSISNDGTMVAYTSDSTNIGAPAPSGGGTDIGGHDFCYVYSAVTRQTTVLDGTGLFGDDADSDHYNTNGAELSADGTHVAYVVQFEGAFSAVFEKNLRTGVVTQISPTGSPAERISFNNHVSLSFGGGLVLYSANTLGAGTDPPYGLTIANSAAGTLTALGTGFGTLTTAANAVVFESGNTAGNGVIYETALGVSAGIQTIGTDDMLNAGAVAQVATSGLTVTGSTNAAAGSLVVVFVATSSGNSQPVNGIVGDDGSWTATLPASFAAGLTDGDFSLIVQVGTATGNSFQEARSFTVDAIAPATPDAPVLDAVSDTGLAHDGTLTDTDTPTLTGKTEAGATVTLIDQGGLTPGLVLGTGIADGNGVYAISSIGLTQGTHALTVTATDEAGNVSAASAALALTVDAIVPDASQAPTMVAQTTPDPLGGAPKVTNGSVANPSGDGIVTQTATPVLSGTALPSATVTLYDTDGIAVLGTAVANAKGAWSITSSALSDGLHALTVTQTKAAGDVSPVSAKLDLTVDTLPPLSPVITSLGGPLTVNAEHSSQVDVIGTAEPNSIVQLHVDMNKLVSGTATTDAEGDYEIDALVAPGVHKLTVIATDAAGNASQPSPVTLVTVDAPTAPSLITPAGIPLKGDASDGYIAGGTVFADLNGNGVQDSGEPVGLTGLDGSFALFGAAGAPLVLTGGVDAGTGLTLPGALTTPATPGTVAAITPLSTLLAALMRVTGLSLDQANSKAEAALGLQGYPSLNTLDEPAFFVPDQFGHVPGDAELETDVARLADTATVLSTTIAAASGGSVTQAAGFAAVFDATARAVAAASGRVDLDSLSGVTAILAQAASESGVRLPTATASATAQIVAAGNSATEALAQTYNDSARGATDATALVADATAIESVEQGAAAPALLQAAKPQTAGLLPSVLAAYTGTGLSQSIADAELEANLPAPRLTPASDTGFSHTDNNTADDTPVFTGSALPNQVVAIETVKSAEVDGNGHFTDNNTVIGVGRADATGHYVIAAAPIAAVDHGTATYSGAFDVIAVTPMSQALLTVGSLDTGTDLKGKSFSSYTAVNILPKPYPNADTAVITGAASVVSAGNDAIHVALQVYGQLTDRGNSYRDSLGTIAVYADGGTTPVGSSGYFPTGSAGQSFTLTTVPLPLGPHTLVLVDTLPSGAIRTSAPVTETVMAPVVDEGFAYATGPLVRSTAFVLTAAQLTPVEPLGIGFTLNLPYEVFSGTYAGRQDATPEAFTDAAGTFALPAASATGVTGVEKGWNPLTGLPIDGGAAPIREFFDEVSGAVLLAPAGETAITPLSTLVVASPDNYDEGTTPVEIERGKTDRVLRAFGLPTGGDLLSVNPLLLAEQGDTRLFLLDAKLLDTVTLLTPLNGFSFSGLAEYLSARGSFDFDDPVSVLTMLKFTEGGIPNSVLQGFAAVIAASNAAIDAHALIATGLADLLSYTLAVQHVAQAQVAGDLATAVIQIKKIISDNNVAGIGNNLPDNRTAAGVMAFVVAADTGANLLSAVSARLAQTTEVTRFTGIGAAASNAATVDFRLSFTHAVTGVTPGAFTVNQLYGLQDATVTGVTAVAGSGGTLFDVAVQTGIGRGALSLTYSGTGLLNPAGRPQTTGDFESPIFLQTAEYSKLDGLALADLNGDGRLDIVATTVDRGPSYSLSLYLNAGGGGFTASALGVPLPATVTGLAVGDVNGDGKVDIVTVSDDVSLLTQPVSTLTLLPGNGDGTFGAPILVNGGAQATRLALGDFNGDGALDIVTNGGAANTLTVLLGNDDGTFQTAPAMAIPAAATNVAVADVNGDGHPDIIATDEIHGTLDVLLGEGDGTFTPAVAISVGSGEVLDYASQEYGVSDTPTYESDSIAVGDLNGDGIADIATVNATDRSVVLLLGNRDGTFTAGRPSPRPPPRRITSTPIWKSTLSRHKMPARPSCNPSPQPPSSSRT